MASSSSSSSSTTTNTTAKKSRQGWSDEETFSLIEAWSHVEGELNQMGPRKPIYEKTIKHLEQSGYKRNSDQITKKISDLRGLYKKEKPNVTGASPSKWKFFQDVHKILHKSHYFNLDNSNVREVGLAHLEEAVQPDASNDPPANANNNDDNDDIMNNGPDDPLENQNNDPDETLETNQNPAAAETNNNSSQYVNDTRPVSESSRLARKRKSAAQEGVKVQQEMLKMFKEAQEEDKEFLKIIKESQTATTNSMNQIASSLATLTQVFQMQAQNQFNPSYFGSGYPGPNPPGVSRVTDNSSNGASSSSSSNYYNL